ncbi:MAG: carboxypeptidase-like regulatory domain-containing protein [Candidatus Acidiferrales bacterium]
MGFYPRLRRVAVLGALVCALAFTVGAAPDGGKISGVVVDGSGTPQMGATVLVTSDQLFSNLSYELLTNDRGKFNLASLPAGSYSIKVTLAGFLPSIEQNVLVNEQHVTLLQIVLGSVFSSFDKLRRAPDQQVSTDEWSWVLRSSNATRPVLRWQDSNVAMSSQGIPYDLGQNQGPRARVELTSGSDHPGSITGLADSPGTLFGYDYETGGLGAVLVAGQYSYDGNSSSSGIVTQWLPSGENGNGPVTTLLIRETRFGESGASFRGLRMSHDGSFAVGDRVNLRYGADLIMAGFAGTTTSVRPRAEVAVRIAPKWQASLLVAEANWQDNPTGEGTLQGAMQQLDMFPTLLMHNGRSVLEGGLHEELALEHDLGKKSTLTAAIFNDQSSNTAVFGRGTVSGPDYLPDFFSNVFAYDGGEMHSGGARLAYTRKFNDNIDLTLVYAYAGALAPNGDPSDVVLRNELSTQFRQSAAARVSAKVPRTGTRVTTSYKWMNGPTVSQQDAYGESVYHIDPYLSVQIHQRLPSFVPGHAEIVADCGNLLAQGYVTLNTSDGSVVLIPTYRYFRGGLSFQF